MITKNIKIGFRRLLQNKAYSSISIGGFAIALAACIVILLFTNYHYSFDTQIDNVENSYRIISRFDKGVYRAYTFPAIDHYLQDIKEVEKNTTCYRNNIKEVFIGDKTVNINEAIISDDSFLDFFGIDMVTGNALSINEPNTVFVTKELAGKLYQSEEAIGKEVKLRSYTPNQDGVITYTIVGIIESMPASSHIGCEMLISTKGHFEEQEEFLSTIKAFAAAIYVQLTPNTNISNIEEQLVDIAEPRIGKSQGPPLKVFNHKLQPVKDIHFAQDISGEFRPVIKRSSLNILLIIGFLIFAMAAINFANMYMAQSTFRIKEYGILRAIGSNNIQLFTSRSVEIFISLAGSFILSILLVVTFSSLFKQQYFSKPEISIQSFTFWKVSGVLIITTIIVVLLSSLFDLTGKLNITKQKPQNRTIRPLVVSQFVIVTAMICFTLIMNKQMQFISQKSLGFTKENVAIIEAPTSNMNILQEEISNIAGVISTANCRHYPGMSMQNMTFGSEDLSVPFQFGIAGPEITEVLDFNHIEFFKPEKEKATGGWLINESFYNNLKDYFTEEQIATSNFPLTNANNDDGKMQFTVLGVIKDFHYESLHSAVGNFAFSITPPERSRSRFILARINQSDVPGVMAQIKEVTHEIYPDSPVNFSFIDEQLQAQYKSETTLLKLVNVFSILSIIIACLGLIGLSLFVTQKRIKEIGVRKVNGASVLEILKMLNTGYLKWVTIAYIIAVPLAYFAMAKWLENFAYKTALSWWIFAVAGLSALLVALVTVTWQSWNAATRNPVEALKCE